MQFDVVQEVNAQAETLVSSRFKHVEGKAEEQKRGLNALGDDMYETMGKSKHLSFDSVLETAGTRYASKLNEWTGKARATVIYDSTVDDFTDGGIFQAVKGKQNIAIVGFTTDGDVFGGFYSVAVTEQMKWFYDPNVFIFSFESHGRCTTPQRFVVKERAKDKVNLFFKNNTNWGFLWFGVDGAGNFTLGNERIDSTCVDLSRCFEGLEDTTLTGNNGTWQGPYHHYIRLVAIRLE